MRTEIRYRDKLDIIPKGDKYEMYICNDGTEWTSKRMAQIHDEELDRHEKIMKTIPTFKSINNTNIYYIDSENKLEYILCKVIHIFNCRDGEQKIDGISVYKRIRPESIKELIHNLFVKYGPSCWEHSHYYDSDDYSDYFSNVDNNIKQLKEYIINLRKYGVNI